MSELDYWLVGSTYPSEKYESQLGSWGYDIPKIWKAIIQPSSKPPSADILMILLFPLLTIINHRLTID